MKTLELDQLCNLTGQPLWFSPLEGVSGGRLLDPDPEPASIDADVENYGAVPLAHDGDTPVSLPIRRRNARKITGLPDPDDDPGTVYIVSADVAAYVPWRDDVLVPELDGALPDWDEPDEPAPLVCRSLTRYLPGDITSVHLSDDEIEERWRLHDFEGAEVLGTKLRLTGTVNDRTRPFHKGEHVAVLALCHVARVTFVGSGQMDRLHALQIDEAYEVGQREAARLVGNAQRLSQRAASVLHGDLLAFSRDDSSTEDELLEEPVDLDDVVDEIDGYGELSAKEIVDGVEAGDLDPRAVLLSEARTGKNPRTTVVDAANAALDDDESPFLTVVDALEDAEDDGGDE